MNELVKIENGQPVVSSKDVSAKFGKAHRSVLASIAALKCSDEFRQHEFMRSSYTSAQNKELPCFNITRDGFAFLCMGFEGKKAGKWKEDYIKAFNSMEQSLLPTLSVMENCNEIIKLMETDKAVASACGKGLSQWKKVKKDHQAKIGQLVVDTQLLMNFS